MAAAASAIKIVLMGQGGVGKTAMTLRYTTGEFNEQYLPTIGDMYTKDVEVNGFPRSVQLDDTAGQGYLLVYSITDDTTFAKLDRLREEILKAQAAKGKKAPPVFLVGTKADLDGDRAVTVQERKAKGKAWSSRTFEVSAKTDAGVKEVFQEMMKAILASSVDPSKGSGGGSVMGAGKTPARKDATPTKDNGKCLIV